MIGHLLAFSFIELILILVTLVLPAGKNVCKTCMKISLHSSTGCCNKIYLMIIHQPSILESSVLFTYVMRKSINVWVGFFSLCLPTGIINRRFFSYFVRSTYNTRSQTTTCSQKNGKLIEYMILYSTIMAPRQSG